MHSRTSSARWPERFERLFNDFKKQILGVNFVPAAGDASKTIRDYDCYVKYLGMSEQMFLDASPHKSCEEFSDGSEIKASVALLYCDTIPHEGRCALRAR